MIRSLSLFLFALTFVCASFSASTHAEKLETLTRGPDFFTWRDHGKWVYAMLPATDGTHTKSELEYGKASDLEELKSQVSVMQPGTRIYWNQSVNVQKIKLMFPGDELSKKIQKIFIDAKVKLIKAKK